jgi:hypothetical protein
MQIAADRLGESEVGPKTILQQRRAHQRLLAIVQAVQESQETAQQGGATGGAPGTPPQPAAGSQTPQLLTTQLRLLRELQAEVKQRTAELRSSEPSVQEAEALTLERAQLADDQQQIAQLARTLLEQFIAAPQEADPGTGAPQEPLPQEQP